MLYGGHHEQGATWWRVKEERLDGSGGRIGRARVRPFGHRRRQGDVGERREERKDIIIVASTVFAALGNGLALGTSAGGADVGGGGGGGRSAGDGAALPGWHSAAAQAASA